MLWNFTPEPLELRRSSDGSAAVSGRFKYNVPAVLSDGGPTGRPRKEVIAARAFAYRVEDMSEDIHLLVGHDYGKPLASRGAGTLKLVDGDDALSFSATLTPEIQRTTWGADFLAAAAAGLVGGISPGFRIPPKRAVPQAEKVENEDPKLGMAIIRTVLAALLYELSAVTRPAYPETQIEARAWRPEYRITDESNAGLARMIWGIR